MNGIFSSAPFFLLFECMRSRRNGVEFARGRKKEIYPRKSCKTIQGKRTHTQFSRTISISLSLSVSRFLPFQFFLSCLEKNFREIRRRERGGGKFACEPSLHSRQFLCNFFRRFFSSLLRWLENFFYGETACNHFPDPTSDFPPFP